MIQLTRLNNARLAVNCDLIKYVEEAPDTVRHFDQWREVGSA